MTLAARPVVKGDETNAAIDMLANLDIKGAIITGDALHCNRRMAKTIIERGADYVLPIKGNQDSLLSDARAEDRGRQEAAERQDARRGARPDREQARRGRGCRRSRASITSSQG